MNWVNRDYSDHNVFDHLSVLYWPRLEGRMSEALRKLIAPYILRRTKEVLADLPDL